MDLEFVFTDRNAAISYAEFANDLSRLNELVNWTLQNQRDWFNRLGAEDRMERRMAEFLVHRELPTEALLAIGTYGPEEKSRVVRAARGIRSPAGPRHAGLVLLMGRK